MPEASRARNGATVATTHPRRSGDVPRPSARPRRAASGISRRRRPENLTLETWQIALRKEFGRAQRFRLKNVGREPVFSEFDVSNPESARTYRVAVRGPRPGDNYCSCPDFAVNTLGTCKHIEFTLAALERDPDAAAALARGFHPPYSEIYLRYGARREVAFRAGRRCPPALGRLLGRAFDAAGLLRPDAVPAIDELVRAAARQEHPLRYYDDARAFVEQRQRDAARAAAVDSAYPQGIESPLFRDLLKVPLYPYQRRGALFAARAGRCLIADEMGLGKTVQALAAAEILARAAGVERVLIVSPASLKHQWKQEIEKFTRRPANVIEGLSPARAAGYASDAFFKITAYDVIHRDLELIRGWAPHLVILDEAQRIKNWKTRAARSVKRLPGEHAIILTGTPLENRLEELHSIVEFVDRFRLGPLFRFLHDHQHADENGRVVGYRRLSAITETLTPVLLRRTKNEVLKDLPPRLEKRFFVPMTPQQKQLHDENYEIVVRVVAKWRKFGFLTEEDQLRLQIALQRMRMSCDNSYLIDRKTDHGPKTDELATLLGEILERPGAKVVVFSQWLRMHELIARRLRARGWGHVLFHGGVPSRKRGELVRQFREDPACRIFLSTDAGGVGLNLQHASAVVNMDLPWNPAVLEQRIGRVHRLGQRGPVRVVNFVSERCIEHGMLGLLAFKKSLFAGVLDGGKDEVMLGGTRLKRFMESVENAVGEIPAEAERGNMPAGGGNGAPGRLNGAAPAGGATDRKRASRSAASSGGNDGQDLLSAGLSFLEKLGRALQEAKGGGPRSRAADSLIARDERTGQPYLKLPVPSADVLQKAAAALAGLAAALR